VNSPSLPVWGPPALLLFLFLSFRAAGQERPYFVAYSHEMEEPGDLEIESFSALGRPAGVTSFGAPISSLNTESRLGGPPSCISMARSRNMKALFSQVSDWRTASAPL
jgi:hypothetical protein